MKNNYKQGTFGDSPKSGYTGITWHRSSGKWLARITINGCQEHLGYYDDKEVARDERNRIQWIFTGLASESKYVWFKHRKIIRSMSYLGETFWEDGLKQSDEWRIDTLKGFGAEITTLLTVTPTETQKVTFWDLAETVRQARLLRKDGRASEELCKQLDLYDAATDVEEEEMLFGENMPTLLKGEINKAS